MKVGLGMHDASGRSSARRCATTETWSGSQLASDDNASSRAENNYRTLDSFVWEFLVRSSELAGDEMIVADI